MLSEGRPFPNPAYTNAYHNQLFEIGLLVEDCPSTFLSILVFVSRLDLSIRAIFWDLFAERNMGLAAAHLKDLGFLWCCKFHLDFQNQLHMKHFIKKAP